MSLNTVDIRELNEVEIINKIHIIIKMIERV